MNPHPADMLTILGLLFTLIVLMVISKQQKDRVDELAKDNQHLRSQLIQETQNHTKCIEKNIELLRQLEEIKHPSK